MNALAPQGQVYVCAACGKTSPTMTGYHDGKRVAPGGWDESCFMHAVLCYAGPVGGGWLAVQS